MKRPDRLALLTWFAIALAVGLVLLEGVALRDAGQRLRAQERERAAARARAESALVGAATACVLPPIGGVHQAIDDALVLDLPADGRFLVPDGTITRERLAALLPRYAADRTPDARAIFVVGPVAPARCGDLAWVRDRARAAGLAVYDARSNYPGIGSLDTASAGREFIDLARPSEVDRVPAGGR